MSGLVAVERCPACDSPKRTYAFESHDWIHDLPGSFALVRCDACASVYPDPRPDPEHLAGYYPEAEYYAYAPPARHRLWARESLPGRAWYATARGVLCRRHGYEELGGSTLLAETVGRLPVLRDRATFGLGVLLHPWVRDGTLLDVGSGSGKYLDLMRALGWRNVVGVDISPSAGRTAADALGIEVHTGDVRELGLPGASFDAVSMSHALEHMDDPAAVLAEVRRLTKPGGRIAILVPNVRSVMSRLFRERWLGLETPRHLVNFSPAGLRAALERAGLRIESLTTSPRGSYAVALFSMSRALGDPRSTYTDEHHRFPPHRRLVAASLSGVERVLCVSGRGGELICAVARP